MLLRASAHRGVAVRYQEADNALPARLDLVSLGETMALLSPSRTGLLRHADALHLSVGGSESNVLIAAERLGVRCAWLGRVGDDELGQRVLREIRGEGVDVRAIVDPTASTGLMIKERRTEGQTRLWYYRADSAGSRLQPADLDLELIRRASILHVTGITAGLSASARASVEAAIVASRAAKRLVSIDLNYRRALWKPADFGTVLRELVREADIVFASPQEAAHVVGVPADDTEGLAHALAALGPSQVIVKLGGRGAFALVDGVDCASPAVTVRVVDTVGAGDAFVAGWLVEQIAGADVETKLRTATACGAYACSVPGDWEGAPTRRDLESMLHDQVDDVER
jgi:2-dehydro-3-deoxygluconokinase